MCEIIPFKSPKRTSVTPITYPDIQHVDDHEPVITFGLAQVLKWFAATPLYAEFRKTAPTADKIEVFVHVVDHKQQITFKLFHSEKQKSAT